ncbi:murein biosynthesis integral membrane protein MurJ [Streptomyces hirsutus]
MLPARWAVVGMAARYGVAYVVGVGIAWRRLRTRLGGTWTVPGCCGRTPGCASPPYRPPSSPVPACYGIGRALGQGVCGSFAALLVGGAVLFGVFFVAARRMRIEEVNSLVGMVRGRLGR